MKCDESRSSGNNNSVQVADDDVSEFVAVDDVIINEVTVRDGCSDFDDDDDCEDGGGGGDVGVVSISSHKGSISDNGRIDNDVNESFTEELLSFQQHFSSAEAIDCSCGKMFRQHKVGHKSARLDLNKIIVSCEKCGSCQHAGCVGYDLTDEARGSYLCPHCYVTEIPIPSGATLIITPNSIAHQWLGEVLKHVAGGAIKLFVYKGVQRQGYIQPRVLARQDIVLTTYETLRAEMKYVGLLHNKFDENNKLRYNKKFISFPTPLVALEWWRVCLDEAQMVEKVSTKPADMACRLVSQIRWCITGTPIQRSFDDLYGLLSFLRACPYDDRTLWSKFMQGAYEGGLREHPCWVISRLLWRNCKRDVIDQINLPPQSIKTHLLTFSPVEEHFYRRMYQKCSDEALTRMKAQSDLNIQLSSLDKNTLHQLLTPLLKIRQACVHPQVVKGQFISINKTTLTMSQLLSQLIKRTRLECEEAMRGIVRASNGMAGCSLLERDIVGAVNEYRDVLMMNEKHKDDEMRIDSLQLIHTIHNLITLLTQPPVTSSSSSSTSSSSSSSPTTTSSSTTSSSSTSTTSSSQSHFQQQIGRTLRDDQLPLMKREHECRYMRRREVFVTKTKLACVNQMQTVHRLTNQMESPYDWWLGLLKLIAGLRLDEVLINRIQTDLSDNAQGSMFISRFRDVRGLKYVLHENINRLNNCRSTLVNLLGSINQSSDSAPFSSSSSSSSATSSSSTATKTSSSCSPHLLLPPSPPPSSATSSSQSSSSSSPSHSSSSSAFTAAPTLPPSLPSSLPSFALSSSSSSSSSPLFSSFEDLVGQTVQCCLRPLATTKYNKCPFCKAHKLFEAYETYLFAFKDKETANQVLERHENRRTKGNNDDDDDDEDDDDKGRKYDNHVNDDDDDGDGDDDDGDDDVATKAQQHKGNWSCSETEKCLKIILFFGSKHSGDKHLIELGQHHVAWYEAAKREFKLLRVLWQALREKVSSYDEMMMAKMRMRWRQEGEEVQPGDHHIVERGTLKEVRMKFKTERMMGENELRNKKSQLNYLKNMFKNHGNSSTRAANPDPCPVCQNKLGTKWSVMQCGHCFCLHCMRILAQDTGHHFHPRRHHHHHHHHHNRSPSSSSLLSSPSSSSSSSSSSFKCPLCRMPTLMRDVSFVCTKSSSSLFGEDDLTVKGDWSTKIEGVVRLVLKIIGADPSSKILIFSTWSDVLDLVSEALTGNDVKHQSLTRRYKFDENLQCYKEDVTQRCLLLPIHSGSNGLNLIESNHVIFVEPILNPAQLLQAVGRVHRIGQTRPTFIHHMLVRNTIEEKLHHILSRTDARVPMETRNSEETTLTLHQFNDLFSSAYCYDDDDDDSDNDEDDNGGDGENRCNNKNIDNNINNNHNNNKSNSINNNNTCTSTDTNKTNSRVKISSSLM